MYIIKRSDKEINDVMTWAAEGIEDSPGLSYEDGIQAMFNWLVGTTDTRPDEVQTTGS